MAEHTSHEAAIAVPPGRMWFRRRLAMACAGGTGMECCAGIARAAVLIVLALAGCEFGDGKPSSVHVAQADTTATRQEVTQESESRQPFAQIEAPYHVDEGRFVHQWIALQAAEIWNGPPGFPFSFNLGGYGKEPDENGYKAGEGILAGAGEEDTDGSSVLPNELCTGKITPAKPFCYHFWNPDVLSAYPPNNGGWGHSYQSSWNKGLDDILIGGAYASSYRRAEYLFGHALKLAASPVEQYRVESYYWLGRAAHLIGDMCSSAHLHNDSHLCKWWAVEDGNYCDPLEEASGNTYKLVTPQSGDSAYSDEDVVLPADVLPGATVTQPELFALAWTTAQISQQWGSAHANGNATYTNNAGKTYTFSSQLKPQCPEVVNAHLFGELSQATVHECTVEPLLLHGMRSVASLYRLFWIKTHPACTKAGQWECDPENAFMRRLCVEEPLGTLGLVAGPCPDGTLCDKASGKCVAPTSCGGIPPDGQCFPGGIIKKCVKGPLGESVVVVDCGAKGMSCAWTVSEKWHCSEGPGIPEDPEVPDPVVPPKEAWGWPLQKCHESRSFGIVVNCLAGKCWHLGVDLQATAGTTVYSPAKGIVKETKYHGGYGGTVVIEHTVGGQSYTSVLGHLLCDGTGQEHAPYFLCTKMLVKEGDLVQAGTPVAKIAPEGAESGWYGEHLHWGVRKGAYKYGASDQCKWTYAGLGPLPGCTEEFITSEFYDPMALAGECDGSPPAGIPTGGPTAPQLVGPVDASAVPTGWVKFQWAGGPATKKYLTVRNLDTCKKIPELELKPVNGTSEMGLIEVPGSYRWTVAAEQPGAPADLGYAPVFTFYACGAPLPKSPADGVELPAGETAFSWTPGEPAKPHGVAVRNLTAGANGAVDEYPASADLATIPLTEPGTYEWWVYYDVKHWIDKTSTCPYEKSIPLRCESAKRVFSISQESTPKYSLTVSVAQPSAGQQFDVGTTMPASWKVVSEGSQVSYVSVDLVPATGECPVATTVQSMMVSAVGGGDPGKLDWPVPKGMPGGDYRVRVSAWSEVGFSAVECSASFVIVACKPQCTGKQCGPDGCGGECGTCPYPKECTSDSCLCPEADCKQGQTQCLGNKAVEQCTLLDGCLSWTAAFYCPVGQVCQAGQCKCAPQCSSKKCGPDGCGGTCGTCALGQFCKLGSCVTVCNPSCGGKQCGDNGCGGSCGGCAVGFHCDGNQCVKDCQKKCFNAACGPDGCGGVCGICPDKCSFCSNGQCVPFVNADCVDDNPCTKEVCDDGVCQHLPKTGGGCQDKKGICTVGDHCVDGNCVPTYELSCDDGNPCTQDQCNPTVGCIHTPDEKPCDDGNACTSMDKCIQGWCTGSGNKDCNDGDSCTFDACFPSEGCMNVPVVGACDDGDPCTADDICLSGVCRGTKKQECDDDNPCTLDDCIPWVGCVHETVAESCDDGDPCTDFDFCMLGKCLGKPRQCDDGNECTLNFCSACQGGSCADEAECKSIMVESPCDDGDPCTLGDHCVNGACQAGPPDCDDGVECTQDTCLGEEGCWHEAVDSACDDGDPCTKDLCKPLFGCWADPLPGLPCDDGDPCTLQDECALDGCFGTLLPCPAGTACLGGKCEVCQEGISFCVGTLLWQCKGGEFTGFDCAAEGGTCVDAEPGATAASCFSDKVPEKLADATSAGPDAAGSEGADGDVLTAGKSSGSCSVGRRGIVWNARSSAAGTSGLMMMMAGLVLAIRWRKSMKRKGADGAVPMVMAGLALAMLGSGLASCEDEGTTIEQQKCTPEARKCSKNDVLICEDDGSWSLLKSCAPGMECVNGDCAVSDVACLPECQGKTCGDDGCGGQCGTCSQNEACVEGNCTCLPDCSAKVCGDDGCGGSCGSCASGKTCQKGACIDCSEDGCTADGVTKCGAEIGTYFYCQLQDGCYTWDGPKLCKDGEECLDGKCQCDGDCTGIECGDDGCGGTCGDCQSGESCQEGVCNPMAGSCEGKECGDDGAGGSCGQCQGSKECVNGLCECTTSCSAEEEGCVGDTLKLCATDESGCPAMSESKCPNGCDASGKQCEGCEKACAGKECGESQGCPCGSCPTGMVCNEFAGQCECLKDECTDGDVECLPSSGPGAYRVCKEDDNGCGVYGATLNCGDNHKCIQGQDPFCVCQPDCENKVCGDDKCGGECSPGCGECEACQYGQCICPPGSDVCGLVDGVPEQACVSQNKFHECVPCGKCGSWGPDKACQANESCFDNKSPVCQCDPTIQCSLKQCGPDGCGGTCPTKCSQWEQCTADGQCQCIKDECEYDGQKTCCPDGVSFKVCTAPATCGEWGVCQKCPGPFDKCVEGMEPICQCQPQCAGKECGPDGCNQGGICGMADCPGLKECVDGLCKCMGEPCTQNEKTCQGNSAATCVQKDGCWTWGTPTSCAWDEVCSDGTCLNKCEQMTCDDGNDCTTDSCANGQCSFLPASGTSCSDGDSCTVSDKCQSGTCMPGSPKNCDDSKPCTTDSCSGGSCKHANVADGTNCGSGMACKAGTCVSTAPTVTSVSPLTAVYGKSTTFTIVGTNLPGTLTAFIPGCDFLAMGSISATKATFSCTPKWEGTGAKASLIKDKPGGTTLKSFTVQVTCTTQTVMEVMPLTAKFGAATTFAAVGACLTTKTVAWIPECTGLTYVKQIPAEVQFKCTPSGTKGVKNGLIKDQAGGNTLFSFSVTVN